MDTQSKDGLLRYEQHLLIAFAGAIYFPILYILRFLDDNSLARWGWVFGKHNFGSIFLLLLGISIASTILFIIIKRDRIESLFWLYFPLVFFVTLSEPEMLIDGGRYFIQAKYLSLNGPSYFLSQWGKAIPAWTDLPLVPFLQGMIFWIFGEERVFIQLLNTLFIITSGLLLYNLSEEIAGHGTGIYTAGFLLSSPYILSQIPLMLVDIPMMFFFILALFFMTKGVYNGGGIHLMFAGVVTTVFFLTKYSAILFIPFFLLILFVKPEIPFNKKAGPLIVIFLVACVLFIPFLILYKELIIRQMGILSGFQYSHLGSWQEGYISTFFFQIHPFVTVFAVAGILIGIRNRSVVGTTGILFFLILLLLGVKRIRYTLPLLPVLFVAGGYGLKMLVGKRAVRAHILLIVLTSSFIIYSFGYLPFFKTTAMNNLKLAGEMLNTLPGKRVKVTAGRPDQQGGLHERGVNPVITIPLLDLFTSKEICNGQRWATGDESHKNSSVRFTWELGKPLYYNCKGNAQYMVNITGDGSLGDSTASDPSVIAVFRQKSGAFRFTPVVVIRSGPLSITDQ